jgi:uncharacterized UBP type Zn finger protein
MVWDHECPGVSLRLLNKCVNHTGDAGGTAKRGYLTLNDCLETYMTSEMVPWVCSKCHSAVNAVATTKLMSLPKVLILHLKRYTCVGG